MYYKLQEKLDELNEKLLLLPKIQELKYPETNQLVYLVSKNDWWCEKVLSEPSKITFILVTKHNLLSISDYGKNWFLSAGDAVNFLFSEQIKTKINELNCTFSRLETLIELGL